MIPSIGADLMARTWIEDIRTWQAPMPDDDGVSLLVETLGDLVGEHEKIGLPMGLETHVRMPMADFKRVTAHLAPREFLDATAVVQRTREIKSEAEVEKIRSVCKLAGRAFERVADFAGPGRLVSNVFRDFQIALLNEGADWVSYVASGAEENGYGDVISPAEAVPLKPGDVLMLDTGAVKDGYFCDFDRNFSVGKPSDLTRRVHEALWVATEETSQGVRPGILAQDVHRLLSEALERLGVVPGEGRLGHGLGVSLTEWPSFTPHDQTELRAGMVLTLEPSALTEHGRLLVHEENILLHDDGAEWLSPRAPFALPELH